MNRLTQLAISRRSVTLLLAAGLFIGGIAAWGSLKQELLPDVSFPDRVGDRPVSRGRAPVTLRSRSRSRSSVRSRLCPG